MTAVVDYNDASMALDAQHLWEQFHGSLQAFIARRVGTRADVDDTLQEVFARVQRSIGEVKDEQRIAAWLYQVTRNVITDLHRSASARRARVTAGDDELEGLPAPSAVAEEDGAALRSLSRCVRPFIEALPELYREALVMTELEGMTHAAAAARIGIKLPAMKARVRRGRAMVKASFLGCCQIEVDARGAVVDFRPRRGC